MTKTTSPRLRKAPIVEAVLDVDCDLPPGFDLPALEAQSRRLFGPGYPKFQAQFLQEHAIETKPGTPPEMSVRRATVAFRCLQEDEKQLVQVRTQGFSFNRLAPYSSLDDYLPEIERTWRLYVSLVSPVEVRTVRLRYINRILVPMAANAVNLDEYFTAGPRLPDEKHLTLSSFLSQQAAIERDTGHQVNLVLAAQAPENDKLPVILDIGVASAARADPADWRGMGQTIASLRGLKNRVFRNSVTPKCIQLFQS